MRADDLAELARGLAEAAADAYTATPGAAGMVAFLLVMALAVLGVLAVLVVAVTREDGRP